MTVPKTRIGWLRVIGAAEAVSYLVLMGVAMPLKYVWHLPTAVRVAGSLHGALFISLCAALALVMAGHKWGILKGAKYFVAALVPFGPFLLDKGLAREDAEMRAVRDRAR